MAIVQETIFSDAADGTAFIMEFDNVTLLATRAIFVVPNTLGAPLTVNVHNSNLNSGNPLVWQAPPSHNNAQFTFSPQLQGTLLTFVHGTTIDWGFSFIQFGSVGVSPIIGATLIHVSPNT